MVDYMLSNNSKLKRCSKCKQFLSLDNFSQHSGRPYPRSECKRCNNELSKIRKQLRKENEEPGLDYRCPICDRDGNACKGEGGRSSGPWVIDHCHENKQFRGWLCHKCNRALGHLNDSIILLNKALKYLTKNELQR